MKKLPLSLPILMLMSYFISCSKTPDMEQIKADLIGKQIEGNREMGWFRLDESSAFLDFKILEKKADKFITEYLLKIRFDAPKDKHYYAKVLVVYKKANGNWQLASSVLKLLEQIDPKVYELFSPVEDKDFEAVREALRKGIDVNLTDKRGMTALALAAKSGNKEMAALLIDNGAEINGFFGGVALMTALQEKQLELAKFLIDRSSDFSGEDYGNAMMFAAGNGYKDIAILLINKGAIAQGEYYERYKRTALMGLAGEKNVDIEILRLLIDRDKNLNNQDIFGVSALMYAAKNGNIEAVKLFIQKGAAVNLKDEDGKTALSFVEPQKIGNIVITGNPEIARILKDAGAK